MKRRAFFGTVGRVAAALGAGAWLKGCVEAAPVHAQVTGTLPVQAACDGLAAPAAVDPQTGVAIRFVKAWGLQADTQTPTRLDAFMAQPPLCTSGPIEGLLHQVTEGERARYQAAYLRASIVARREAMEAGELAWWSVDARAVELVHVADRYQRGQLEPCYDRYYDIVTDALYDRQTLEELVPLGPADFGRGWMHPSHPTSKRIAAAYREGVLSPEFGSSEWFMDPASPHAVPPTFRPGPLVPLTEATRPTFVTGRDLGDETFSPMQGSNVDRVEGRIERLPDGTHVIRPDLVTGRVVVKGRF